MSLDIFAEHKSGLASGNSCCDMRPQVSLVCCAFALACRAERLAWVAGKQDAHSPVKVCVREGLNIRPDRRRSHFSRFNLCNHVRCGECFPLHISDRPQANACSFKSKLDAAVACAEREAGKFFGIIHTGFSSKNALVVGNKFRQL